MANQRKTHLCGAAQPSTQFVQLEAREVQGVEAALMEEFSVPAGASEPGADGGLPVALRPALRRKDPTLRPAP